jgi:glycosidase
MEDFKRLLEEAHKRDIKVIIDMVLNHTSSEHPWFVSSQTAGSEYKDWYIWSDTDPGTPGPWGEQVWHKADDGQYYYGVFSERMPDLNYNNPAVREESKKIASFWLKEVGVDGFRLDAARYVVEEGTKLADTPANHKFWEEWGTYVRSINPQAFTVGEIATGNTSAKKYVSTNTELDSAFNFDLATAILKSVNDGTATVVRFLIQGSLQDFPEQDNSNFITNHDQNRAMSQFMGDTGKAKVAAGILITAPGIPFLYYGEEIGMSGVKPDEQIRTPMQWTGDEGAGFTNGTPWEAINPDYTEVNVQAQTNDNSSLLEHYRKLIQLRNEHSALQAGKTYVAKSSSDKLLSFLRSNEEETVLVVINMDDKPVSNYSINLKSGPLSRAYNAVSLLDDSTYSALQANTEGGFDKYVPLDEIPPHSVIILKLNKQ